MGAANLNPVFRMLCMRADARGAGVTRTVGMQSSMLVAFRMVGMQPCMHAHPALAAGLHGQAAVTAVAVEAGPASMGRDAARVHRACWRRAQYNFRGRLQRRDGALWQPLGARLADGHVIGQHDWRHMDGAGALLPRSSREVVQNNMVVLAVNAPHDCLAHDLGRVATQHASARCRGPCCRAPCCRAPCCGDAALGAGKTVVVPDSNQARRRRSGTRPVNAYSIRNLEDCHALDAPVHGRRGEF
eukprot:352965-Chlamydomonas_euryale.AAC.19